MPTAVQGALCLEIEMRRRHAELVATTTILILLLGACAPLPNTPGTSPTPTLEHPSPTMQPSPQTPTVPLPPIPTVASYQRVAISEVGLSFQVPSGWDRLGSEWAWAPPGTGGQVGRGPAIGVNWDHLDPSEEAEAILLPWPSEVVESESVQLSWGDGRRFTLEVFAPTAGGDATRAPVISVQTHVLVVVAEGGGRLGFDIYATGETLDQLTQLDPFLEHMLDSSELAL
jgi:hypothetical protein